MYQKLGGTARVVLLGEVRLRNAEAKTNGTGLMQGDKGRCEREQHGPQWDETTGG